MSQELIIPPRRKTVNFLGTLAAWAGRSIGLRDGRFWSLFYSSETWTGKSVTPDTALQVMAFWACIRLLSSTIGSLPFNLYVKKDNGDREVKSDHPLYRVIHDQPNADQTAVEFWEGVVAQLCIWGNFVALKELNSLGQVIGLEPFWFGNVKVIRDGSVLRYEHTLNGVTRKYSADDLLHIRGFGYGGDVGIPPLMSGKQALGLAMATDEASGRTFANGMRPGGFFTYDKTLTKEQRADARATLVTPYSGTENAGKIGILEAGFKWQEVQLPPMQAQMLESRQFNIEEVCRLLGVPPIMIGHASAGQTMWGSGIEQILTAFYTLGLRPTLVRIEKSLRRSCLSIKDQAAGIYAEVNFEALLRADSAARATFYSQMVQNGIMTRNEIRVKENLPRHPDGDALTAQVNMAPLGQLGEAGTAAAASAEAIRQAFMMLMKESERQKQEALTP